MHPLKKQLKMKGKYLFFAAGLVAMTFFSSCDKDDSGLEKLTLTETFESGANGWEALFGSYPEGEEEFYDLGSGIKELPEPLDQSKKAFMLTGNNHSDALRMFMVKQIGGFVPGASYQLNVSLKLASMYPSSGVGIGGSPGSAVHIVAFAAAKGYQKKYTDGKEDSGYYEIEIIKDENDDKAQSTVDLGTVGIDGDEYVYKLINRQSEEPLICKADENGKIWIIVGTWSGFEGITTLYYDELKIEIQKM